MGDEYNHTRHNIGFEILDGLAKSSGIFFEPKKLAHTAELKIRGRKVLLIKPSTFMNLSGKAINYYLQSEKIPVERLLVITDDVNLTFGTIRIRTKGSSGGHNGLKNIEQILGTSAYTRLRFGVGNDYPKGAQVHYVLGKWNEEQQAGLPERISRCEKAIESWVLRGSATAMNEFNNT